MKSSEARIHKKGREIKLLTSDNRCFFIEADEVANDRANYYANRGDDWQEEYDYVYGNDFELWDWLMNNMDWYECETLEEVERPKKELGDLEIEEHFVVLSE